MPFIRLSLKNRSVDEECGYMNRLRSFFNLRHARLNIYGAPRKIMRLKLRKKSNQQGVLYIELLIVFLVLLPIGFLGYEASRTFQLYNTLSAVSREAAREIARSCGRVEDRGQAQICVDNVSADLRVFAENLLPGTELIVTLVQLDSAPENPPTGPVADCSVYSILTPVSSPPFNPLVGAVTPTGNASRFGGTNEISDFLQCDFTIPIVDLNKPFVGISEVYFRRTSSITFLLPFIEGRDFFSGVYYETTIY